MGTVENAWETSVPWNGRELSGKSSQLHKNLLQGPLKIACKCSDLLGSLSLGLKEYLTMIHAPRHRVICILHSILKRWKQNHERCFRNFIAPQLDSPGRNESVARCVERILTQREYWVENVCRVCSSLRLPAW